MLYSGHVRFTEYRTEAKGCCWPFLEGRRFFDPRVLRLGLRLAHTHARVTYVRERMPFPVVSP